MLSQGVELAVGGNGSVRASSTPVMCVAHFKMLALLLGITYLLSGCGDEDGSPSVSVGRRCMPLTLCDIRDASCQTAIFDATACQRAHDNAVQPPVFTVNEAEALAVVTESAATEQDPDGTEVAIEIAWNVGLSLLGLAPPANPSGGIDVSGELLKEVAAFYVPASKEIYIIDRGEDTDLEEGMFILSHEFVHSLQDQTFDLTKFRQEHVTSSDAHLAITALVEGEATVLSTAVLLRMQGRNATQTDWPAMGESFIDNAFEGAPKSEAPFFSLFQGLPYGLGVQKVGPVWTQQGQAGTDALFENPPLSVGSWLESDPPRTNHSLQCLPTVAPAGYEIASVDRFGPTGVAAARLFADFSPSSSWTVDWHDDLVVLFVPIATPTNDAAPVAISWRTRFADAIMAQQFATDLMGNTRFQAISITVDDEEVLVFGSNDAAVLDSWNPEKCGTKEDLIPMQEPGTMPSSRKLPAPLSTDLQRTRTARTWFP